MNTLSDVCEAIVDCEHKTAPAGDGYALSVGTRAMKNGAIVLGACKPVGRSTFETWTRRMTPRPGDLILAREAPVGQVVRVPEHPRVCLGQRTVLIRPDQTKVEPRFLHYWLLGATAQDEMRSLGGGATVAHVNVEDIRALNIEAMPTSVELQRAAADTLGTLDELIENNLRRIGLLAQMALATYREWFVHFRVPGHEFGDATLPAGWTNTTLGAAAKWISGGTPNTQEPSYWNGDIPWITSGSLKSMLLDRSDRTISAEGLAQGLRLVERDTLLFVVRGMSLVKEFRVGIADVPLAFGQDCKALVARPGIEALYLAFAVIAMADEIQGMVELAGHGTGKLSTDRLQAISIPVPPSPVQKQFVEKVQPLRALMSSIRRSSDLLQEARTLLLPRLVTGKVDLSCLVPDDLLEEAAIA